MVECVTEEREDELNDGLNVLEIELVHESSWCLDEKIIHVPQI